MIEPTCLLTTKEAAKWMRCSEETIRKWVHNGWLTAFVVEPERLFSDADLIEADNRARSCRSSARGSRTLRRVA